MLTQEQKTEALEALNKAQNILNDPGNIDEDIQCSLGSVISDVYDMEVKD